VKGDTRKTVLFDTGPEELLWELNTKRLNPDIASIEVIHLSHWHRDHSGEYIPESSQEIRLMLFKKGGMLKAISLINAAKAKTQQFQDQKVTVDLHPSRPDFRGVTTPIFQMSLEADPEFEEIEAAGGRVSKNDKTHNILDDFFLVSGEIPRHTSYEKGLRRGSRFSKETGKWTTDELIMDERLLMCKLKGTYSCHRLL
jgi:7,8-dihydropterin-6-yl-methyl-4-(beta-D-ribofuranosyl)aminobenzene 5'-phosphate synthase